VSERRDEVKLQDGTLIRHKVAGYEGRIDGTTEIKTCFTAEGKLLDKSNSKQTFQYRVAIEGQLMRRIAPAEDLEILEEVTLVICPRCHRSFRSKPGLGDKPRGRCQCGGWICPSCLACQGPSEATTKSGQSSCPKQQRRLATKLVLQKKRRMG